MDVTKAEVGQRYLVKSIDTDDSEVKKFLLTLGCYPGEDIYLMSVLSGSYSLSVKDGRYCIDKSLAALIQIEPH